MKSRFARAPRFSSSWATLDAPTSVEATVGSRSTQRKLRQRLDTALGDTGGAAAISRLYSSRWECMRAIAELKVEGPAATVSDEEVHAASPGTWTISSLMPSGS